MPKKKQPSRIKEAVFSNKGKRIWERVPKSPDEKRPFYDNVCEVWYNSLNEYQKDHGQTKL